MGPPRLTLPGHYELTHGQVLCSCLSIGTYYLPDRWPAAYGLLHDRNVPSRWTSQFVYPMRKRPTPSA